MRTALNFGIVALIALAFTAAPGGGESLAVIRTLLSILFFVLIAGLGYRLFRQYRFELETLSDRQRLVLYGSVGLAFLTLCATARMIDAGGLGFVAWLVLLALCSYGVYWVWTQYRSYA
jgi:hypothetical protein